MRKIVVYELLSLDGVAEDPDAFFPEWDDVMDANLGEVIGTQDAVILGRRSYAEWSRFWPDSDIQPFSTFINGVEKHIVTSAPLAPEWSNAQAVQDDPVAFARRLKEQEGGDIGVHASIRVAQTLLAADLVDDLRLVISPRTIGVGRRLFDGLPPQRFETVSSVLSPVGALIARYRVVSRDEGAQG